MTNIVNWAKPMYYLKTILGIIPWSGTRSTEDQNRLLPQSKTLHQLVWSICARWYVYIYFQHCEFLNNVSVLFIAIVWSTTSILSRAFYHLHCSSYSGEMLIFLSQSEDHFLSFNSKQTKIIYLCIVEISFETREHL